MQSCLVIARSSPGLGSPIRAIPIIGDRLDPPQDQFGVRLADDQLSMRYLGPALPIILEANFVRRESTMNDHDRLFAKFDISDVLRNQQTQLAKAIDELNDGRLLEGDQAQLIEDLVAAHLIAVPVLDVAATKPTQREIDIDVSRDPNRFFFDRSSPFYVKGTEVCFEVPCKGDAEVFQYRPSVYSMNSIRAEVQDGEIVIRVVRQDQNSAEFRKAFDATILQIQEKLTQLRSDCAGLENALRQAASARLAQRRTKREKDRGLIDALGFGKPKN